MTHDDDTYAHNSAGQGAPEFDQQRFIKLCEMLASSSDGERAVAAKKATELLRQQGWTWGDVVGGRASSRQLRQEKAPESGLGERAYSVRGKSGLGDAAAGHQYWRDGASGAGSRRESFANNFEGSRQSNPRLRQRCGLLAIDVVYAVFSTNPDLGEWEAGFIDNLVTKANIGRPSDFALTEKQWERLLDIAKRSDLITRTTIAPETYSLVNRQGDHSWARR